MINNTTHTIPALQGTLAKRIKPALQPNFAKEPFSPSHSNSLDKSFYINRQEIENSKNGQRTTNGISHGGVWWVFEGFPQHSKFV
jgi:hypothetical protein